MKITLEYTWHLIGDSLQDHSSIEDFNNNLIIHADLKYHDLIREEVSNFWQEWLSGLLNDSSHPIAHDIVYTSSFQADMAYYTDYMGEVDLDCSLELLSHESICTVGNYLAEHN